MKIIFMGTPEFAVVSLKRLLAEKLNVSLVVTAPDRPAGRGLKPKPSAVKTTAMAAGIPVLQPESLKDLDFLRQLEKYDPDLIVVVAFRILPEAVFGIPKNGAVNVHASLLPRYRGAAPINWAIINGETETGVTTFFIQKKVDTGNIIAQKKVGIGPEMTAGELHDILAAEGADLIVETIHQIAGDKVQLKTQDDKNVTLAPKLHKENCHISFLKPAAVVHNFIRGLSPYPGAHCMLGSKRIRLFKTRIISDSAKDFLPGIVIKSGREMHIQCDPGIIAVEEIHMEGKRRMLVGEFSRGNPITNNTRLT